MRPVRKIWAPRQTGVHVGRTATNFNETCTQRVMHDIPWWLIRGASSHFDVQLEIIQMQLRATSSFLSDDLRGFPFWRTFGDMSS